MSYREIQVVPVVDTGAYADGDAVGAAAMEFVPTGTEFNHSGRIVKATILDNDSEDALLHLELFSESVAAQTDNDAFAVSDADLKHYIGSIEFPIASYHTFTANSVCPIETDLPYYISSGSSLFGQLWVETSTPTYTAATDITVILGIHDR